MQNFQFTFDVNNFNNIFPFYILIDKSLSIKSFGKSLVKILPFLNCDDSFTNTFSVIRPYVDNLSIDNFNEIVGELIIFKSFKDESVTLRGQINQHNNYYLFIGNPWFQSMENVVEKKLTLNDFAKFDPLIDLLHVLKNQEINNQELKELLDTINTQKNKLKKDKEELNKLSLVASANKNGVVFTDPNGKIFWCNQSYLDLTGFSFDEIICKTPVEIGKCELSSNDELNKMIKAFYDGDLFEVEGFHAHKKDLPFWAKITGQPVYDEKGKLIQYFATIENNTLIKEKEEQLHVLSSIADKNINAVVICDKNGNIEWINDSFIKLTGYSKLELIGRKPGPLLQGPETDKETKLFLSEQIKKGKPFGVELINYSKNQRKYWVRIQGQALFDKNGEIFKYFAVEEDITFEKEFQQKIIDSENKLHTLIENLQSGVVLENEKGEIIVVNKKFCSLFGISLDSEKCNCLNAGEKIKNYFVDPEEYLKRIHIILKNKKRILAEEITLKDGRVFERNFLPIYKNGNYAGQLWSYDDVTLKKRYKESLDIERQKYGNIIANMNMGLLEVDKEDNILFANQSFCDMSEYSLLELIGNKASDLLMNDADKKNIVNKNKLRKRGISDSYEVSAKTKNGELKHWLISGAPNYNFNGELIGSIGIHLDITNQKKLEIQKEQLLKKLEKQNEQLSEYAQIVSHDLKSPLRSIHSLITWIREDNDKEFNEVTKKYLNMIEGKVEKMDHLIHGILTYSKVDSKEEIKELVDLNEVVNDCIRIIHIPENIKINLDSKLPIIKADKFRMQQIFQNLISNAVIYIDKPEGIVNIGFVENKMEYVFYVKDNGPGISKENQDKIFKIFKSFSQHESSTGIGLSIVKRIVDKYKGSILIESEINLGTKFIVKFPKK